MWRGGRTSSPDSALPSVIFPPRTRLSMATVLIVEDEDQVRVLAESYLREQGHQTVSAATAEEALAVFEVVKRIDVLFTDINRRGDSHWGLNVAKQARERQPDLAVLYATGQAVT